MRNNRVLLLLLLNELLLLLLLLLLRIEFVKVTVVRPGAAGSASELLLLLARTTAHTGRQRSDGPRVTIPLLLLLLLELELMLMLWRPVIRYSSSSCRSTASASLTE